MLAFGQKIQVEITKIDDRGKLSLAPVVDEAAFEANTVAEPADTDGSSAHSAGPVEPAEGAVV
ncbi:MAG: polyribonucleotide nucleotidyltransferase [Subtercola sp.]|nr:polyribonucleotide nucleotidyltransferase [Subtercola sp.]